MPRSSASKSVSHSLREQGQAQAAAHPLFQGSLMLLQVLQVPGQLLPPAVRPLPALPNPAADCLRIQVGRPQLRQAPAELQQLRMSLLLALLQLRKQLQPLRRLRQVPRDVLTKGGHGMPAAQRAPRLACCLPAPVPRLLLQDCALMQLLQHL